MPCFEYLCYVDCGHSLPSPPSALERGLSGDLLYIQELMLWRGYIAYSLAKNNISISQKVATIFVDYSTKNNSTKMLDINPYNVPNIYYGNVTF